MYIFQQVFFSSSGNRMFVLYGTQRNMEHQNVWHIKNI